MLSGMARRAAKSGAAAGQDELRTTGAAGSGREERETERAGEAGNAAGGGGAGRQPGGLRKSAAAATADRAVTDAGDSVEVNGDSEEIEMETETVPQLDGADDKDSKRDKKEVATGAKRGRSSTSGAPPTKALHLSSGERVAATEREEGDEGEEGECEGGECEEESEGTSKKEKPAAKLKPEQSTRRYSTHRPRTRSLSNSDSPLGPGGLATPTKTSPMTRSHSAVKKDVEFVSLPSTKKRKKGGGRWPKRDTPSPSPSHESTTPTKQTSSAPKTPDAVKSQKSNQEQEMTGAEEEGGDVGEQEEAIEEAPPPQPTPPPKRRRGRPPKRKDFVTPGTAAGKGRGSSVSGGVGGGRGRGKKSLSAAESEKKVGVAATGRSKVTEGGSLSGATRDKPELKWSEGSGAKSSKSLASVKDDETEGDKTLDSEAPLPSSKSETLSATTGAAAAPEKKKKKRRASGEDGKMAVGDGKTGKSERASRKASAASSLEEEMAEQKNEKSTAGNGEGGVSEAGKKKGEEGDAGGNTGGQNRGSVFVSVLSGPTGGGASAGTALSDERDSAKSKEEEVEVVSQDPGRGSRDLATSEEAIQKSHLVQSTCSPTLPYPATTIPPFPHHAAYPYPGAYPPPPLMFPGPPSNPLYPHYYHGYPPLPPPPPPPLPTASSQPMPGSFIPTCPPEPMPPSFPATQSLTTTVGGVQVSILDKAPSQLSAAALSPLSPHALPASISSQGQQQSTHTVAMELARHFTPPHPLSQTYRLPGPGAGPYIPHSPYISVRIDPTGMPFVDWGIPHSQFPPHHPKVEDMGKINSGKLEPKQEEVPVQSVECPECGRSFKNNKALNGHMRLHGGFDWTKKPFSASQVQAATTATSGGDSSTDAPSNKPHPPHESKKSTSSKKRSGSRSPSPSGGDQAKNRRTSRDSNTSDAEKRSGEPSIFTFDTSQMHPSQRVMPPPPTVSGATQDAGTMTGGASGMTVGSKGATLDDLCRAVEALEKMENGGGGGDGVSVGRGEEEEEEDKRRPENIRIPTHTSPSLERDRHRLGSTPPYTPPPILSPARSMALLSAVPGTPSRILQPWSARRSSDHRKPSEVEEGGSYMEPKINIGRQFQAVLPPCSNTAMASDEPHKAHQAWTPLPHPLDEDNDIIDGFLELACSPAVRHAGRNKEYALHVLHSTGGSVKEAVRLLLMGKSVFSADNPMATYHYSGSRHWSARERQQFRRAWRVHRKQFHLLKSAVEGKTLQEVTEYYYYWKKYCSDEYRGRNRHVSEEIMSDEDMAEPHSLSSDTSSSSSSEAEPTGSALPPPPPEVNRVEKPPKKQRVWDMGVFPRPHNPPHFDLPIVYAPHSSKATRGAPVQQYKCKYPGCTQVFTSIFALNGHIRIHGGSFYPKADKKEARSASPSLTYSLPPTSSLPHTHHSSSSLPPSVRPGSNGPLKHGRPTTSVTAEMRSAQHLEIARALLDLPQPRSPARGGAYHTPSPKPSPGNKRSPLGKKKMSSSSPGEHEGYYPCNRCGRVFTKVKSRSAHMKSHIMKPS